MRFLLRFAAPLLMALTLLAIVLTPVASDLVGRWFQRDLQLRARLIRNTVGPSFEALMRTANAAEVVALFDSVAEDERVLALAWCDAENQLKVTGKAWPRGLSCPVGADESRSVHVGEDTLLQTSFPIEDAGAPGKFVILHDISFIDSRSTEARLYLMGFLALISIVAAGITMLMAHLTLRGWLKTVHGFLLDRTDEPLRQDPQIAPIMGEIRQLIRDLDISHPTTSNIHAEWSPEVLRRVLTNELPGSQVIVVSNREPYIHNHNEAGSIVLQRPASGMVTALEPIMRACGGTWIAHGSGTADRETVDRNDHLAVPPQDPSYTLRRVWLSEEEQKGYYYGLANEGLWPLCHVTFVRPIFRESDWQMYQDVNRKFADAVAREAKGPDPLIFVQDYHFALLPKMIRERLPNATIVTFWHIPWPNAEVFGIYPWREALLDGLLGSSIIGFHTQLHCNNFIDATDRFIESHIDREEATVSVSGRRSLVRPYPISIAWPPEAMLNQAPVAECRRRVFEQYALTERTLLFVGVERFDFTKGIPDRFRAVEILLEAHPEFIGRFVLLQIAAPTRSKLAAYDEIKNEAGEVAERINKRFGMSGYKPILLVARHHEPEQVFEAFRAADACIVNSLHDGMNLVAKEFVAARDDDQGVLILSTFAGASRELMEALIVNPFDARLTAEALYRAIQMSPDEQRRRMQLMRQMVSENNIYHWAGRMLLDAARIRKRKRLEASIALAAASKRLSA